ncbi:MAG: winged helix-turn-helix domain-containing protein [Janthinobacterium lividum]
MRIALLDPQNARAEHYRHIFIAGGYRCHSFMRVKPFLAATLRDTFDLAVIVGPARELVLRQALATLTRRAVVPAIMMLSAHAVEADMIDLLDAGVDDCLAEPAGEDWLLARTRALLRRARMTQPHDAALTHFDGYRFDPVRCRVETPAATLTLTPKELALALLLFRNQGRDLSRQYLVDGVWARESGPSSRSLDTHISRIRQKLSLQAEYGYQLTAIYSHGYRLDRAAAGAMGAERAACAVERPVAMAADTPASTMAATPMSAHLPAEALASAGALAPADAPPGRARPSPTRASAIALASARQSPSRQPGFPLARLFAHDEPSRDAPVHGGSAYVVSTHGVSTHDNPTSGDAQSACVLPVNAAPHDSPPPVLG